jgi:hypothetical protein
LIEIGTRGDYGIVAFDTNVPRTNRDDRLFV